jgi:hypothetical protein
VGPAMDVSSEQRLGHRITLADVPCKRHRPAGACRPDGQTAAETGCYVDQFDGAGPSALSRSSIAIRGRGSSCCLPPASVRSSVKVSIPVYFERTPRA